MMRIFFPILFMLITTTSAMAQTDEGIKTQPSEYQWHNRILIVIADSESNNQVEEQLLNFEGRKNEFEDRDLITFFVFRNGYSRFGERTLHSSSAEAILEAYGSGNTHFRLLLIGKDGGVKLQKNTPVSMKDIFGLIDSMPMRQREMRESTGR